MDGATVLVGRGWASVVDSSVRQTCCTYLLQSALCMGVVVVLNGLGELRNPGHE